MRKIKTLLYALGTATMPVAIVYGVSNYIAAQQPNTPPLQRHRAARFEGTSLR